MPQHKTINDYIEVGTANAQYITDGVADDVQIQAAFDAAAATSGGKIIIKSGTYTLAATVTIATNNLEVICEDGAKFNFPGNTVTTAFKMADTTQRTYIRLVNFQINSTSSGNGLAIDASHFAVCKIENPIITGCNKGIDINSTDAFYNHIVNPRIAVSGAGAYGIRITNGANENTVTRARISGDANTTGVIVNSHDNSLYDVDVETGVLVGIDIQASANDTTLYSPYLEANITNLKIASGVEALNVIGGFIVDGSTANITDAGSVGTNYIGVRLQYDPYTSIAAPIITSGIGNDGSGVKHQRVTTGSIAGGSTGLVTVTWTTAFTNSSYTVSAQVVDSTTTSLSLSVVHIETISASAVTVRVLNNAVGALTGTLHCMAIHD